MAYKGFRWEQDNFFWEVLRLEELGLPDSWNVIVPDKLTHFLLTFCLVWLFSKWVNRWLAALIGYVFVMTGLWEVLWDGCFRYGASWKDMIANTLGAACCVWWLGSRDRVGQSDK